MDMTGQEAGEALTEVVLDVSGLNENQRDIIAREHGLGAIGSNLVGELTSERAAVASVDVRFTSENPTIPAENVVSRLGNYAPTNASQELLLSNARRLVTHHGLSRLAGLIACGPAGVGKTHIAVGVAKQAMLDGQIARYLNMPSMRRLASTEAEKIAHESDIVILDDANQQYGSEADLFRLLLAAMHDKGGGKLLVTTNFKDPEQFIVAFAQSVVGGEAQTVRLLDRIRGSLLPIMVEGESYRRTIQADQSPWWMEEA